MCIASLLKEAIDKECPQDKRKRTWAQVINEQLLKMAKRGDISAIRLIYEYVEGKPKQAIEIPSEATIRVVYDKDGKA